MNILNVIAMAGALTIPCGLPALAGSTIEGKIASSSLRCWEKGDIPAVTVILTNHSDNADTATVVLDLRTDTQQPYRHQSLTVAVAPGDSTKVVFNSLSLSPGFYRANVTIDDQPADEFCLGFSPTEISSPSDAQADFREFWSKALRELAEVTPEYKLVLDSAKSTATRNVYLVEMKSLPDSTGGKPVTIRGYYTEPTAPGKYPVLITYQGYDDGKQAPYWAKADDDPGWVEFYLSTRGQILNNRGDIANPYGDWFAYNFGDKDHYYYRGAFMDAIRAIDFVTSREKADTTRIFAQGQSQGGALTVASAALGGGRIKAIAPAVTFLGDFPDYFRIVNWPADVAFRCRDAKRMTDEEMYRFLSYFDTKNLAQLVSCPVCASFGLQDPVCPPHTNFASYNLFTSATKRYVVQPFIGHTVAPDWYNTFRQFFLSLH